MDILCVWAFHPNTNGNSVTKNNFIFKPFKVKIKKINSLLTVQYTATDL